MIAGADAAELSQCLSAIGGAAPELMDLEPLSLVYRDAEVRVVRTAGGAVFHLAQSERGAEAAGVQVRLLPFLRGHVEATVPQPAWEGGRSEGAPFGLWGHGGLPGVSLQVETVPERLVERLAGSIALFLLGLHGFPTQQAQGLEVPGPRAWRDGYERAGREGLPALRKELGFSEFGRLRRWWRAFLAEERNWSFEPVLVQGDLGAGDLLVDREQTELVAVDGFGSAALGDRAVDFAELVRQTGTEFSWRVVDGYRSRGGEVGANVLRRVRVLGAASTVKAAARSARSGDAEGLARAVAALRAGPVLGGGS